MEKKLNFLKKSWLMFCVILFLLGCFPSEVSAANRDFNKKSTVEISEKKDYSHTKSYTWLKYKAPENGYITIKAKNRRKSESPKQPEEQDAKAADVTETDTTDDDAVSCAKGSVRLFDSKKKSALSSRYQYDTDDKVSAHTVVYGVKKKETYYLRVNAKGAVAFQLKFTKVNESSGSVKSKAKELKKNKQVRGIIAAGDKTADWYKLKVPKKQTLHFYYAGKANEKLRFTFSGTYIKTTSRYVTRGNTKLMHTYSAERVQPGTYYVKVERSDSQSSGYYILKWK